ncbi:MAG: hypothetical protein AVDCRST_MAG05-1697, partial [uncultured Rubrobacteraceae bacterium]
WRSYRAKRSSGLPPRSASEPPRPRSPPAAGDPAARATAAPSGRTPRLLPLAGREGGRRNWWEGH